jgi:hypothetical protein
MIGKNGVTAAESPVCEVRNSGETGTVLEMQRWLCDHHARRELSVLAIMLPSDDSTDEGEAILDTKRLTNSNEVRDAPLEETSSPPLCMSCAQLLRPVFSHAYLRQHQALLSRKTQATRPQERHRFT